MGNSLIPVARAGELAPSNRKIVDLGGRSVVVANINGHYFAFARECPHEGADLERGHLVGDSIRCDNHSYFFDLHTGECVSPKGGPRLTVLPVEQHGEEICIRIEW